MSKSSPDWLSDNEVVSEWILGDCGCHQYQRCCSGIALLLKQVWNGTACIFEIVDDVPFSLFRDRQETVWMFSGNFDDPMDEFIDEILFRVLLDDQFIKTAKAGRRGQNIVLELKTDQDIRSMIMIAPLEN